MKTPYTLQNPLTEIICPDCGSQVKEDEDHIAETGNGKPLHQYVCEKCKLTFIPAVHGVATDGNVGVNQWASKVRQAEGMNEGRSWRVDKSKIIIIRKK